MASSSAQGKRARYPTPEKVGDAPGAEALLDAADEEARAADVVAAPGAGALALVDHQADASPGARLAPASTASSPVAGAVPLVPADVVFTQMQAVMAPLLARFDSFEANVSGTFAEVKDMVADLKREHDVTRGRVDAVTSELAAHRTAAAETSARLAALEKQVEALRSRAARADGGGGDLSGDGGFVPAFIELEGWTTWADRATHGVTRPQAETHIEAMRGAAPAGLREHIGRVVLFQHMNSRVRVLVGDGRAREVQDWAKGAYTSGRLQPMRPGADMRVKLQKSPAQQQNQDRFLRGLRAVEARLRVLAREPGWVPRQAAPVWQTFTVIVGDIDVGSLSRDGEWTWYDAGLRVLQVHSGGQLLACAPARP